MTAEIFLQSIYPELKTNEKGAVEFYSSPEKELDLLKWGTSFRDVSSKVLIQLSGEDTIEFLHRISTNSVKEIEDMKHVPTLFLNQKGKIIEYAEFLKTSDKFFLIGSGEKSKLEYWLSRYIIMEDIKTEICDNYYLLEISGAQSDSYMTMILGEEKELLKENKILKTELNGEEILFWMNCSDAHQIFYFIFAKENSGDVLNYLMEHSSVFDVGFVGEKAYEVYRISNGIASDNYELSDSFNPYDINLIDNVSFTKGCYIGQEVIARIDTYENAKRELKGAVFLNGSVPNPGNTVYNEYHKAVGEFASIASNELLTHPIGLAIINCRALKESEEYFYEEEGKLTKFKLVDFPIKL